MRRTTYNILLLLVLSGFAFQLAGQPQKDKSDKKEQKKPKPIPVYLGDSDKSGGALPKRTFDALLKQGLSSRDSAGRSFRVHGFLFSYAERSLYEDSVGNLMFVTDYLSEYCMGDTLTKYIAASLFDRTKPGDTVYFDQITVYSPEGQQAEGQPMRFILK